MEASIKNFETETAKETKTLKLTKGQSFAHYAVVLLLLIAPAMTSYSLFQIYVTKNYTGVRSVQELMITGFPWLIPALILLLIQNRRLKFTEINLSIDKELFQKAAEITADNLGWKIEQVSTDCIKAVRRGGLSSGSWGEMITIIRYADKVFINSICDPDNKISIASFGWNKKNVRTFRETLEILLTTKGFTPKPDS